MTNTEAAEPVFEFTFASSGEFPEISSTRPDPQTGAVTVRMSHWGSDGLYSIEPNVSMFQSALDQITNNPESWNQQKWLSSLLGEQSISAAPECGTAGCLAGTVALLSGARPHDPWAHEAFSVVRDTWATVRLPDERIEDVSEFATTTLGITSRLANVLFYYERTLVELWELGQVLCGGQLSVPEREVIEAAQRVSWHLYGGPGYDMDDRVIFDGED